MNYSWTDKQINQTVKRLQNKCQSPRDLFGVADIKLENKLDDSRNVPNDRDWRNLMFELVAREYAFDNGKNPETAEYKISLNWAFNLIEVYQRYIPSEELLGLILNKIQDESARLNFLKTNNTIVWMFDNEDPEDPCDIKLRELITELIQNYRKQGEVIGEDVTGLIQSIAVVEWFATMVPEKKESNIQDLRKEVSKHNQHFKKSDRIELDRFSTKYATRYSDLKIFSEYAEAWKIRIDWIEKVVNVSNTNQELKELIKNEKQLLLEIYINREKSNNPYFNICQFCKKHFLSCPGEGRKMCGSDECKRKYSAVTKERSRTHANSKKKRSSGIVINQWVKVDNTTRLCDGKCERRRLVNERRFCKQCHNNGFL